MPPGPLFEIVRRWRQPGDAWRYAAKYSGLAIVMQLLSAATISEVASDVVFRDAADGHLDPGCMKWKKGVGRFAEQRAVSALGERSVKIAAISHPSPANPKANKGWEKVITKELKSMGIG